MNMLKGIAEMLNGREYGSDIPWTYKTNIPHLDFNIMEEGEVYCEGLVFFIGDL